MATQNLRTVVTLGGAVDSSFSKIGSTFTASMGKATKTVKELEREQNKLTKEIRKSKLAGADVSLLTHRYRQLGQELDDARDKADAFDRAANVGKKFRGIATAGATAVGSIWVTGTALAGLMTITNQNTASMTGMAQAYDMSIDRFKAWNGVAQQAGLEGENVGDLVEELTNKFGEFKALGEQSSVADVFGSLGIDQSMMDGMAAADQFEFIMSRLENVGDKQQAASLADMLFGGEGNKLVTYIRNTGQSLDSLLDKQRSFNLLSQRGADGAVAYGNAFRNLTSVVQSAWQEIAGIVGGEMSKDIETLATDIGKYIRENKEAVAGTLKSLVYGAKDFTLALWSLGSRVNQVVQLFGGWETVGIAVTSLIAGKMIIGLVSLGSTLFSLVRTVGLMKMGMAGLNVVMAANPIGLVIAAVAALIAIGISLYTHWDAVTSFFQEKFNWFKTEFPATFEFLKNLWDWSPLGLIINNWSGITDFFKGLWGGITGLFESGIAKITGIWDTVTGWLDAIKFWDDSDSKITVSQKVNEARDRSQIARAQEAISSRSNPERGNTVNQSVGEIKVYASPSQSPQEVAQAVHSQLGGYQNSALYDLPEAS